MKTANMTKKSGFTLVELLIVISIIALLAMLIFPVFAKVRENARRASCVSNMKQLSLGFMQYSQDYDGRLPSVGLMNGSTTNWVGGADKVYDTAGDVYNNKFADPKTGTLWPYIRNEGVYVCPSTEYSRQKKLGYSMNCILGNRGDSSITEPSSIVLLVDEDKRLNDGLFSIRDVISSDGLTGHHNETGNLLFADGHVKSYRLFSNLPVLGGWPTAREGKVTGTPRFNDPSFDITQSSCPLS